MKGVSQLASLFVLIATLYQVGSFQRNRLHSRLLSRTSLNDFHVFAPVLVDATPIDPGVVTDTVEQTIQTFTGTVTSRVIGTIVGNLAAAAFFKFLSDVVLSKFNKDEQQDGQGQCQGQGQSQGQGQGQGQGKGQQEAANPLLDRMPALNPGTKIDIPPEAYLKLVFCVVIDLAGDASFMFPGVGEVEDLAWAPVSAVIMKTLFDSNLIGTIEFAKEILPFSDIVPLASLCWSLQFVFPDSPLAKTLKLDPISTGVAVRSAQDVIDMPPVETFIPPATMAAAPMTTADKERRLIEIEREMRELKESKK